MSAPSRSRRRKKRTDDNRAPNPRRQITYRPSRWAAAFRQPATWGLLCVIAAQPWWLTGNGMAVPGYLLALIGGGLLGVGLLTRVFRQVRSRRALFATALLCFLSLGAIVALTALDGWKWVATLPFGPLTGSLYSLCFAGLGASMMLAFAGISSVTALIRGDGKPADPEAPAPR